MVVALVIHRIKNVVWQSNSVTHLASNLAIKLLATRLNYRQEALGTLRAMKVGTILELSRRWITQKTVT